MIMTLLHNWSYDVRSEDHPQMLVTVIGLGDNELHEGRLEFQFWGRSYAGCPDLVRSHQNMHMPPTCQFSQGHLQSLNVSQSQCNTI